MKKNIFFLSLTVILFFVQTIQVSGQTGQVTITINPIEYENANLKSLKEALKKTPKVTGLKSSYAENAATLTMDYPGTAEELWDKVPAANKKNFKLILIDEDKIELTSIIGQSKSNVSPPVTKSSNQPVKKSDCFDCDYFPFCKFDFSRSFNGEIWKGIDNDDGNETFYHCKNGEIKMKIGTSIGFETFTALKCNEPKGYSWNETIDLNGVKFYYTHTILDKGFSLTVNGQTYPNVLKVYRKKEGASMFLNGQPVMTLLIESVNIYFAKNVGEIKREAIAVEGGIILN